MQRGKRHRVPYIFGGIDDVFLVGTMIAILAVPLTFLLRKKKTGSVELLNPISVND
ncbi:hypothetical protein [Bacillus sp. SA1-12]|uniref:hypothetical protein n=1 Tax=Bacillus sp. SA1-12 TaxID=1455638 RepID=UPI000AF944CB|nr:hypothetical protein [Bacillus sp. SA1-12]